MLYCHLWRASFTLVLLIGAALLSGIAKTTPLIRQEVERFESVVLPNTQIRHLTSAYTKQNYKIYVNIPASYTSNPTATFPALFILDADYGFALAKQISEHHSDRGHISELLIFGVAYDGPPAYRLHRTRDYTPVFVAEGGYGPEFQKHSGGAIAFADFLEHELTPYLQRNFRLANERILAAHSYGGLFTAWMLASRSHSFTSYLALSPSLWYGERYIFDLETKLARERPPIAARAFFAIGSRETKQFGTDHPMVEEMQEFIAKLKSRAYPHLVVGSEVFAGESHDTLLPAGLSRGLLFVLGRK